MSEPVLSVQNVSRTFKRRTALQSISLEVQAGELLALIGPNGGGKSTLLLLAAGLLKPSAGTIRVCGVDSAALAAHRPPLVGLVTARPGIYPLLTGWENLEHFLGLYRLSAATVRERARPILTELKLLDAMDHPTSAWSTGMQQKLSLARALLLQPRLLLLDEPTANLDPSAAHAFFAELRRRVGEGLAAVLVTHDLHAAELWCDRAALIQTTLRHALPLERAAAPATGPLLNLWRQHLDEPTQGP